MPTTFARQSAFQVLYNEELGFRLADPLRVSEKSLTVVVPIIRQTAAHRQYITLPEAGNEVDIHDTGRIDRFAVKNSTKENVFIRFGTIFKGNTQERALLRSAIVFAGFQAEVEVRCIHASRGIRQGAKTVHSGFTPLDFDQVVYGNGFRTSSQADYWNTVRAVSSSMAGNETRTPHEPSFRVSLRNSEVCSAQAAGLRDSGVGRSRVASMPEFREDSAMEASIPEDIGSVFGQVIGESSLHSEPFTYSDDLAANMEVFARNFDDVIRAVEMKENQAGFALITPAGVETIETFDHSASWKAIHSDAVKRVGQKLVNQEDLSAFEFKPEKAKRAIRSVLSRNWKEKVIWEHKPNNGDPHVLITGLSADGYTGEVVEVDHRVIHLALIRMT
jgi:hypothetical protein